MKARLPILFKTLQYTQPAITMPNISEKIKPVTAPLLVSGLSIAIAIINPAKPKKKPSAKPAP